jgi:hypothetical protein
MSVYHIFTRIYAQTHVNEISVHKGSQWALLNATVRTPVDTEGAPLHQRTLLSEVVLLKIWNSRLPCQILLVASIGNCILRY